MEIRKSVQAMGFGFIRMASSVLRDSPWARSRKSHILIVTFDVIELKLSYTCNGWLWMRNNIKQIYKLLSANKLNVFVQT